MSLVALSACHRVVHQAADVVRHVLLESRRRLQKGARAVFAELGHLLAVIKAKNSSLLSNSFYRKKQAQHILITLALARAKLKPAPTQRNRRQQAALKQSKR